MKTELKELVDQLQKQSEECEKTYSQIQELALKSDDHELKFYALTSLGQHFGHSGIPQAILKLKNKVEKE